MYWQAPIYPINAVKCDVSRSSKFYWIVICKIALTGSVSVIRLLSSVCSFYPKGQQVRGAYMLVYIWFLLTNGEEQGQTTQPQTTSDFYNDENIPI